MKIGVLTDFLDYRTSGIGNYIQYLVENLLEIDQKNEYLLIHTKKQDNRLYEKAREVIMPPFILPPKRILRKNLMLPKILKKEGIDLIHETLQITPSIVKLPSKSVLTIHDIIPLVQSDANLLWKKYNRHVLARACENTDKIIAVSENTKKDLIKNLNVPGEKISVIYYGLDERFKPKSGRERDKMKIKYGLSAPFILHVGSFERRKNIPALIKAFNELRKKGLEHKLVLAGEKDHEYGSIGGMVKELKLEEEVNFIGHVTTEDLPALYSLADLFVYPSLYEGFGLPPLEAMACGTPVVCSNRSSLPEVVGDAGRLINPDSVDELADAMYEILIDDDLRQEMAKKGLNRVKQFSWRKAAEQTLKVYEEVVGND